MKTLENAQFSQSSRETSTLSRKLQIMHSLAKFYLKRRLGLDNTFLAPATSRNMKTLENAQFSQISR